MKNRLFDFLKLAAGVGLLFLLYYLLQDPAELREKILSANIGLLMLGAFCYASAVAVSGWKWGILLRAIGIHVSFSRLLTYQWVAEFFNNFLPAQVGGDVMRGYALAVDTQRRADAAASVLIDRFIGLTVFMLAAAIGSMAMLIWGRPDRVAFTSEQLFSMRVIALGSGGATLALAAVIVAMLSRRLKQGMELLMGRLPLLKRATPLWHKLAEAFNAYRHQYRALFLTALGSTLIVILTSVNIWLIAQAYHPGSISLLEVLVINPMIVFVLLALPFAPGGLGVRQLSFAGTFLLIGVSSDIGVAVGLLQQFIGYLVSLPGGYLWLRGRKNTSSLPPSPLPSKPSAEQI